MNTTEQRKTRTDKMEKIILRYGIVLTFFALLATPACSTPTDKTPENREEKYEEYKEIYISRSWIDRQVRTRTLERMLEEQNQEQLMSRIGKLSDDLISAEIIIKEGDRYRVETDTGKWDIDFRSSDVDRRADQPLKDVMKQTYVDWCGEPVTGIDFTYEYTNRYEDAYHTLEDYFESIDDYVDCGTGAFNSTHQD